MDPHEFVQAFRLQNFMGFEDTGWIEFRPITLLFGRNSTGKSALMRSLLLLRQSILFPATDGPFSYVVDGEYDFGSYSVVVRDHNIELPIVIWFRCMIPRTPHANSSETIGASLNTQVGDNLGKWVSGGSEPNSQRGPIALRLRLEYRFRQHHTFLHSVDLIAPNGDVILQAIVPESFDSNGNWRIASQVFDVDLYPGHLSLLAEDVLNIWKAIVISTEDGFLPSLAVLDSSALPESYGEVYKALDDTFRLLRQGITTFLKEVNHIRPVRATPQRVYHVSGRSVSYDSSGSETVRRLTATREKEPAKFERIRDWMNRSELRVKPDLVTISEEHGLYELVFIESQDTSNTPKNALEVGSGLTQVLPVVVDALLASSERVIALEQPELHLHPRAQAELADLFISVAQQGTRCFVETHSEHLLLRFRRRIAETAAEQNHSSPSGVPFADKSLAVYFIDQALGRSICEEIHIDAVGEYENPPAGFRDFFADDMQEVLAISRAARKARQKEHN